MSRAVKFRLYSPGLGGYITHVGESNEIDHRIRDLDCDQMTNSPSLMDQMMDARARLRGVEDHVKCLEAENTQLATANRALRDENIQLKDEIRALKEETRRPSHRKLDMGALSPPITPPMDTARHAANGYRKNSERPLRNSGKRHAESVDRKMDPLRLLVERTGWEERDAKEMEVERRKEEEHMEDVYVRERLRKRFAGNDDTGVERRSGRHRLDSDDTLVAGPVEPQVPRYPGPMIQLPTRTRRKGKRRNLMSISDDGLGKESDQDEVMKGTQVQLETDANVVAKWLAIEPEKTADVSAVKNATEESGDNSSEPASETIPPEANDESTQVVERCLGTPPDESNGPSTPEAPDLPTTDEIEDVESSLDSRPPSPWQGIISREAEVSVAISAWQMINRLSNQVRGLGTERGWLVPSGVAGGVVSYASGSSSSSDSAVPVESNVRGSSHSSAAANGRPSPKRGRDRNDEAGDSDNEDNGRSGKRANISAPEELLPRPRFACPYQKYDPLGTPFCCMPNTKNPEGGADTFPRIKSHIFRNHDPFKRCPNCWKKCGTEEEATGHKDATNCIKTASPGKYWMTEAQRHQVKGQRFVTNGVDNWFYLFDILLPDAYPDGGVRQKHSPYYSPTQVLSPQTASTSSVDTPTTSSFDLSTATLLGNPENMPTSSQPPAITTREGTIPTPTPAPPGSLDFQIPFATLFPTFVNDMSIDDILGQQNLHPYNDIAHPPLPPVGATTPIRTTPQLPSPPPSASRSSSSLDQSQIGSPSGPTQTFLLRDNERLRVDNAALQDEVETLRKRQGRMQGRLAELWNEVRSSDRMLQELLYHPSLPENENERVVNVNHLFGILEKIGGVKRSLNCCQEG
ncbi:hypothetical protein B0T14DRAFT_551274 [Immersiella caudata]|uniref:Uncharacterized protein n=1 Tax=Immersiella caudata TaxID=314043 RepID=A0AA39X302_9PEZI|nr:hypothetical protein B0T14DRAFT_551274 [Immersiella caudata]